MSLTASQKRFLRARAHDLHPIVIVGGGGVTEAVLAELERALTDHELIKVRVRVGDRRVRNRVIEILCERSGSGLVQRVGHVAVLYRANAEKPRILIPDQ